jgi:hypothetical protein
VVLTGDLEIERVKGWGGRVGSDMNAILILSKCSEPQAQRKQLLNRK